MSLLTKYSKKLNPETIWNEYPRMNCQRDSFTSLNGFWKCAITKKNEEPVNFDHKILVPFPVGSVLSGIEDELKEDEVLWYQKKFYYNKQNERTILHFEAVDQKCAVILNGKEIGKHQGGYIPFSFDITDVIEEENLLIVAVMDKSNKSPYAYGKQRFDAKEIWYKPFSGIWGTVWLEDVDSKYIKDIHITPFFDKKQVLIELEGDFEQAVITIRANGEDVFKDIVLNKRALFQFEEFIPWNTDEPFLYDVYIETETDYIKSYFGMRKFSREMDSKGFERFFLNNKPLFLTGLLDQGYISDGLVTYPSDEAMIDELIMVKNMGFNMLRKHVKVENARWYYHCDQLGILVMQDMVNGGDDYNMNLVQVKGMLGFKKKDNDYKAFARGNEKSRKMYEQELEEMIRHLSPYTCIFAWCLFNEGWGQFDALNYVNKVKNIDETRLVDHASGWFDQGGGDFHSRHVYFVKYHQKRDPLHRISLLSEFGGFSYVEYGHVITDKPFGYKKFKDKLKYSNAIKKCYEEEIIPAIDKGLSGCIYTQLSDVETELNGIMTYDRKVIKTDPKMMKRLNQRMIRMVKK